MTSQSQTPKRAELHRMVMDKHVCPYGLKSRYLLQKHGFKVDDHWLTTREETDAVRLTEERFEEVMMGREQYLTYEQAM